MSSQSNTVRLFIAVPSCIEVVDAAVELKSKNAGLTGTRWVRAENLHLTILFLGETDPVHVPFILAAMESIAGTHLQFYLNFESFTLEGGKTNRPSMIWARFNRSRIFSQLSTQLRETLSPKLEIKARFNDPVPHITMARIRSGPSPEVSVFLKCAFLINEIELWKSNKSVDGVSYTVLGKSHFRIT